MKSKVTTHDHAPAAFGAVEDLSIKRAEFDAIAEQDMSVHIEARKLSDAQKLVDKLALCEKQREANRVREFHAVASLQYTLEKVRAERAAAIMLLVIVVVMLIVGCVL